MFLKYEMQRGVAVETCYLIECVMQSVERCWPEEPVTFTGDSSDQVKPFSLKRGRELVLFHPTNGDQSGIK